MSVFYSTRHDACLINLNVVSEYDAAFSGSKQGAELMWRVKLTPPECPLLHALEDDGADEDFQEGPCCDDAGKMQSNVRADWFKLPTVSV